MIEIDTTTEVRKPAAPPFQFGLGGLMLGSTAVAIFFATWIWSREWAVFGLGAVTIAGLCYLAARTSHSFWFVSAIVATTSAGFAVMHLCTGDIRRESIEFRVAITVRDFDTGEPIKAAYVQIIRTLQKGGPCFECDGSTDCGGDEVLCYRLSLYERRGWVANSQTLEKDDYFVTAIAPGYEIGWEEIALHLPDEIYNGMLIDVPIYLEPLRRGG